MKPKNAQPYYIEEQLGKINAVQRRMYRKPRTSEQQISNLLLEDERTRLIREALENDVIPIVDMKTGLWKIFRGSLT